MPLNKEALIRYRVINRCLVNKKLVSKDELIRACEEVLEIAPIGGRTIAQDINDMRNDSRLGYFAPIKFDRFNSGYYYDDPNYSIDNIPLNSEEMGALSFAATMLNQFQNIEIFSTFSGAIQKIVNAVNVRKIVKEKGVTNFIEFEKSPFFKGSEYLETIINAITEKNVLQISYQKFNSKKESTYYIHPYLLKEYRNRWYLTGLNDDVKEVRTYGLDRVNAINVSTKIKYCDGDFDSKSFFKNTIGITTTKNTPQLVVLRFDYLQGNFILTQPIHESQEVISVTDKSIEISLEVDLNFELIATILSWGDAIEVISPKELRDKILANLKDAVKKYK